MSFGLAELQRGEGCIITATVQRVITVPVGLAWLSTLIGLCVKSTKAAVYLTKVEYYMRIATEGRARTFGRGEMPKRNIKRWGDLGNRPNWRMVNLQLERGDYFSDGAPKVLIFL